LEDDKEKEDRKPIILLSDSAFFLFSSQEWIGGEKSPSMCGNPDADIMRYIVQLLREHIEQGLRTVFIKMKAHRDYGGQFKRPAGQISQGQKRMDKSKT